MNIHFFDYEKYTKGPLIISGNAHNDLAIDIANYIGQDLTKAEVFRLIMTIHL